MPWFYCDLCGDSIKKPALQKHFYQCGGQSFSCIDCCVTFDRQGVTGHSSCVTEHEKYALAATKPGGSAADGGAPSTGGPAGGSGRLVDNEPTGLEFLSARPPWKCSVCKVSCTSKDTLMSHAAGIKHKRRARAATAAANGEEPGARTQQHTQQQQVKSKRPAPPSSSSSSSSSSSEDEAAKKRAAKKPAPKKTKPASSSSSSSSSSSEDEAAAKKKAVPAGSKSSAPPAAAAAASSQGSSSDDDAPAGATKAAAAASKPAPAAAAPAASSSSSSESSGGEGDEGRGKTGKPAAAVPPAAARASLFGDPDKMAGFVKALAKAIASKGSVGSKVLRKLAGSKLELSEKQLSPAAVKELRKQMESQGVCMIDGKKLVPAASK
ncbi:hypothetical protein FOA52_014412 [Chlamydomonas sp. UWO 241]|nr:hypothetical protein FOA52_014412 [Chlamydomonas sp. UWO 241]